MDHKKEQALRLAKELHPNSSFDELLINASKLEDFLEANDCRDSFPVFARKCTMQHPVKGYMAFEPYLYQKELINFLPHSNRILINTSRQMGTTFLLGCYALWEAVHKPFQNIVVGSSKFNIAQGIQNNILISYDQYSGYKPGLTRRTGNRLEFSNGSVIIFTALTENSLRGLSINTLIVDNAAYVSHSVFYNIIPVVAAATTKIILSSSPNCADGLFYALWEEANDWFKVALPWYLHPDRDQAWASHMKTILDADQFAREMECKFVNRVKV